MDTQRPANREHAIDRLHEFREPVLEFRELVDHDKQISQLLIRLALAQQPSVIGDIADLPAVEQLLAPRQLVFERDEVPADARIQIGYASGKMRQILEREQQAGALKVDQHETDHIRWEADCHRQDPGLHHFGLAGAGRARDKAVRPVPLFMNIKQERRAVAANADRDRHAALRLCVRPVFIQCQLRGPRNVIALQERHRARQRRSALRLHAERRHAACELLVPGLRHLLRLERLLPGRVPALKQHAHCFPAVQNIVAFLREQIDPVKQVQHADAKLPAVCRQKFHKRVLRDRLRRCAHEQVPRLCTRRCAEPGILSGSGPRREDRLEPFKQCADRFGRVCDQARRMPLVPAMRQPAAEFPLRSLLLLAEHDDPQIAVAVMGRGLHDQIFPKRDAARALSHNAAGQMLTQRNADRAVRNHGEPLRDLRRLLREDVAFQPQHLFRRLNREACRERSAANAQGKKILVAGEPPPQLPVDRRRSSDAHIRRRGHMCKNGLLFAAKRLQLTDLLLQIRAVCIQPQLLLGTVLFLFTPVAEDRYHHADDGRGDAEIQHGHHIGDQKAHRDHHDHAEQRRKQDIQPADIRLSADRRRRLQLQRFAGRFLQQARRRLKAERIWIVRRHRRPLFGRSGRLHAHSLAAPHEEPVPADAELAEADREHIPVGKHAASGKAHIQIGAVPAFEILKAPPAILIEQRSMLSGDLLIRDLDIAVRVPADREPFRPGQRHRNGGLCAARVRRKREMRVRIQNERFFIRELLLPEPGAGHGPAIRVRFDRDRLFSKAGSGKLDGAARSFSDRARFA